MPLQNRVLPTGEIVTAVERGTMMGNRGGCLHDEKRRLTARRWASRQWICCVLAFKGRKRQIMAPGRYTELFFLDEATALAAGHRPCFECRRAEALRFAELWAASCGVEGRATAAEMDLALHAERIQPLSERRLARLRPSELPDGAMVLRQDAPFLVMDGKLLQWSLAGYGEPVSLEGGLAVAVLTPPRIIGVLKLGYVPKLHASAAISR